MSTKITNKQVKIISNVDFNEKEIENAIIDAEKNEITNLDIPTKVSELENDSGYTTTADVNSEIIANSNSIDQELDENSYNAVTNNAIVKGIDVSKTSVVDSIVDTLPSGTLSLGQSVYNTTDKKIYKTTRNKIISAFNINGTVTTNAKGEITNIGNDNYLYQDFQYWVGISPIKLTFSPANNNFYSTNAQIFTISRADDNSVLFEIALNLLYPGTYDMYIRTRKRDGTVVDTASLRVSYNNRIVFEITKSCYVKVTKDSTLALIRYFDSLKSSNDIDDDFYYGIGGNIKISSLIVTSSQSADKVGIGILYGLDSIITYQYQSSPSSYYIVNEQYNSYIWDEGTLIEKNKLLCNATTNILYRYNGNALEEISPNLDNYQKKLTAGDNITISGEGYINFSNTNYLKFINNILPVQTSTSRDFIIKFNLSELNRNNTLIYSVPSTDKYWYLEINNENKLSCTYINSSGTLRTVTGTHTFQANKDYWVYVTATLSYPQGVFFIEDNGYNLSTLPTTISGWTFDFEGTYDYIMMSIFYNQEVYLGYNLTNTANYLKGAIGECAIQRSQNQNIFILSEAVESSSFINNGCLKGPAISAIVPEIDSALSTTSENAVQNKVISNTLNEKLNCPTIVTDSGSSLPSVSGYQEGDTFLNTSARKIYKVTMEENELNTNLVWDNGTDLTDKSEVVDKTNGALYIYENSELVKIGGSDISIETLYLAKVGTLTINDGVVSGISSSSYLKMINFDPSKPFEFKIKFKANQIRSVNSCLIGYKSSGGVIGISIGGDGASTLKLMLSTDSSSWNIADIRGTTNINTNVDYYIKFTFKNSNYILSLSTDDITYTTECVVASSSLIYNGTKFDLALGTGHPNEDWHFDGTIYLNSSSFQQDGVRYNLEVAQ